MGREALFSRILLNSIWGTTRVLAFARRGRLLHNWVRKTPQAGLVWLLKVLIQCLKCLTYHELVLHFQKKVSNDTELYKNDKRASDNPQKFLLWYQIQRETIKMNIHFSLRLSLIDVRLPFLVRTHRKTQEKWYKNVDIKQSVQIAYKIVYKRHFFCINMDIKKYAHKIKWFKWHLDCNWFNGVYLLISWLLYLFFVLFLLKSSIELNWMHFFVLFLRVRD